MRLLIYIVCTVFTFVSLGGNIYMHQCKDATLLSLYNQVDTENCPFCEKHHHSTEEKDEHCAGECKDSTLKIDQLSDQNININSAYFVQLSPAIIHILWISNFKTADESSENIQPLAYLHRYTDSSPPIYLQNCIFRI